MSVATAATAIEFTVETKEQPSDARELQLFRSLDVDNDGYVTLEDFCRALALSGLHIDDLRLNECLVALQLATSGESRNGRISESAFCDAIRANILLVERALQGQLVIPDFKDFSDEIDVFCRGVSVNRDGAPADYIPQLAVSGVQADHFGVAVCTVDGQRHSVGDSSKRFSVQSTCKTINYCIALEEAGEQIVHSHVGHEPSGVSFNELTLNRNYRPHNPLINAGAIMCCALMGRDTDQNPNLSERDRAGRRLERVLDTWQKLTGGDRPGFNISIYLSERETADRNFALAYFMREKGAFPANTIIEDVLELYFQCCSIEVTAEMMSVVAATLANGGICPTTGERVFDSETVRRCLAMMSSCGMYDYSGEFAFTIGLPAKSGVSGAIMVVVPNVLGLCTWSPRLDELGNSVRGIEVCRQLVRRFNFHNYDSVVGLTRKSDPRMGRVQRHAEEVNRLIWAASKGDVGALQRELSHGGELDRPDYDHRTPLHLACAEGRRSVVEFFIERADSTGTVLNPKDRWGGTPLDDAYLHGHGDIVDLLEANGGTRGKNRRFPGHKIENTNPPVNDDKTNELLWAASLGDQSAIHRLVARGARLDGADYDYRTALHLAAAEGHAEVVRYLLNHGIDGSPKDRWRNTPLGDAAGHNQQPVVDILTKFGATR